MNEKIKFYGLKLLNTGFFHIFGSNVINKVINFCSSIILVRILTKEEYGVFTYAWNIYSILILANGIGMEPAILQLCSEKSCDKQLCKKITNTGTIIGIRFNIIICIVLTIIGFIIPLAYDGANTLIKMLCFLPLLQLVYNLICVVLRYQKKNNEYSKLTVINTLSLLVVSVLGALLFKEKGLIIGYYISYIISVIVGKYKFGVRLYNKWDMIDYQEKRDLISIGFVSMMNNGISGLLYLLDVFILGIVAADESVLASYKVATIIPTALVFIPSSLIIYVYPYFSEHKDDTEWCLNNYKKIVLCFGSFNLFLSCFLFLAANYFIMVIFGGKYQDAIPIFRILAINYFISGTFRIISGNLLVTQRKLKFNTIVALVSGLINIIADYYFIKLWGAIGAALATLLVVIVSSFMSTSYLIYSFKKK